MAAWLHEAQYSLVIFTVLIQLTVGALWVLAAVDLRLAGAADPARSRFTRLGTAVLVPAAAVGLLFSTTHLGRPLLAVRALRHWETSWMSREIWATGLFFGLIALYTLLWWWRPSADKARRAVGAAGAAVGALTVVTQAMIYLIPGRPMWNHWSTVVLFFGSAFTLGPLAVAAAQGLAAGPAGSGADEVLRSGFGRLGSAVLGGAAVYALGLAGRLTYLSAGAAAALATAGAAGKAAVGADTVKTALLVARQAVEANGLLLGAEVALAIGAPAAVGAALWLICRRGGSLRLCRGLASFGMVLTLLGHLAGRALFYLTGQPWF